ncbi:MAG: hypothetical protein KatS3mg119_1980 [Rhodothalassiaceae bacterium]|nr:MAG: hypothetical protein KatS3mg119_1980 [Rhodothalassiaceae bacterium]
MRRPSRRPRRRTIWPEWQLRLRRLAGRVPPVVWQALALVGAVLVASAGTRLLGSGIPAPNLALIAVFALTLTSPGGLSTPVVAGSGLLIDLITGAPFGVNVLALLFVHTILRDGRSQFRQAGRGALGVFFFSVALAYAMMAWSLGSLASAAALPVGGFLVQAGVTVAAWILLVPLLLRLRLLPR